MFVFIWDRLDKMSTNYHEEGGLVVVAESIEKAHELLREPGQYGPPVPEDSDVFKKEPDATYAVGNAQEPRIFTFPDAGCC